MIILWHYMSYLNFAFLYIFTDISVWTINCGLSRSCTAPQLQPRPPLPRRQCRPCGRCAGGRRWRAARRCWKPCNGTASSEWNLAATRNRSWRRRRENEVICFGLFGLVGLMVTGWQVGDKTFGMKNRTVGVIFWFVLESWNKQIWGFSVSSTIKL